MSHILVSGLINIETTLRVDAFPIPYFPVRYPFFGVASTVSGVGYNVAKALSVLGDDVRFLSMVGTDVAGDMVCQALDADGLPTAHVLAQMAHTAQSVILYDGDGRRQIHTDLKDVQEQTYPPERFVGAAAGCDLVALCNVNFSRPLLRLAQVHGLPIATDVHAIASLEDPYNAGFLAAADVLFMSDELLSEPPEDFARRAMERYGNEVVVVGLGSQGALLVTKAEGVVARVPAVFTQPVVSTIGAGDALFACFVHFYVRDRDPLGALQKAVVFASHKIGVPGAADGFVDEAELECLMPTG
jgi:sugar/nucleoside kinase (ribokinase family)